MRVDKQALQNHLKRLHVRSGEEGGIPEVVFGPRLEVEAMSFDGFLLVSAPPLQVEGEPLWGEEGMGCPLSVLRSVLDLVEPASVDLTFSQERLHVPLFDGGAAHLLTHLTDLSRTRVDPEVVRDLFETMPEQGVPLLEPEGQFLRLDTKLAALDRGILAEEVVFRVGPEGTTLSFARGGRSREVFHHLRSREAYTLTLDMGLFLGVLEATRGAPSVHIRVSGPGGHVVLTDAHGYAWLLRPTEALRRL